jgi:tetratricopeptide (TPR) repeat protein
MSYRIICQPAVFMNHDVLKQAEYLDSDYNFLLDHNLWVRIARLAPVMHISHEDTHGLWAAARHHPQAKNVAQASQFSNEVFQMLAWMESQPDLARIIAKHETDILAGAYRLSARYLLDGGEYSKALKMYAKATAAKPSFAMKHWHRILYATACVLGIKGIADRFRKATRHKAPNLSEIPDIENWTGIRYHNNAR